MQISQGQIIWDVRISKSQIIQDVRISEGQIIQRVWIGQGQIIWKVRISQGQIIRALLYNKYPLCLVRPTVLGLFPTWVRVYATINRDLRINRRSRRLWYSKTCFERPLKFTIENGRKLQVILQRRSENLKAM